MAPFEFHFPQNRFFTKGKEYHRLYKLTSMGMYVSYPPFLGKTVREFWRRNEMIRGGEFNLSEQSTISSTLVDKELNDHHYFRRGRFYVA